jgi:proteasome lid subunit RPN8/RPN11
MIPTRAGEPEVRWFTREESHELRISRRMWRRILIDLARRGAGERESGAFLLAARDRRPRRVVTWIPFDELDSGALNGAIAIRGEAFVALWRICADRGLRVIADIHTHPGAGVAQSSIDQANPMVAQAGHVGLIIPYYARHGGRRRAVGVHVYRGNRTWASHYGREAARMLRLTPW